jgi:hypothetical protein
MATIFNLGPRAPSLTEIHGKAAYWISVSAGRDQPGDGGLLLGRRFHSRKQLEEVAAEIQSDLDRVIDEARQKFGSDVGNSAKF